VTSEDSNPVTLARPKMVPTVPAWNSMPGVM
jgi:hypothetical protein